MAATVGVLLMALVLGAGRPAAGGPQAEEESARQRPRSVLYVWAGDEGGSVSAPSGNEYDAADGRDFLAVVDADPTSAAYGKVLRTVSVPTPATGHEAHHLPPFLPSHCTNLVTNGLFTDFWFTFDVRDPLRPALVGTVTPEQTIGTVPQFAAVLPSCEVLGTEQGGPTFDAHGTVIRLDETGGRVLEERPGGRVPADLACGSQWTLDPTVSGAGGPFRQKSSADECLPASPLGIAVRPDLHTAVTGDFASPGRLIVPGAATADVTAFTVRHFRLEAECVGPSAAGSARCLAQEPTVVVLPDGPRPEPDPRHRENVAVEGLASTHPEGALNPTGSTPPRHLPSRGAFAATTCGGALYYTPDVAAASPVWREVFDFSAAHRAVDPATTVPASCVGGGGLAVTPDNRFVVASVIGREEGQTSTPIGTTEDTRSFPGMVVLLDVTRLVRAGTEVACRIDHGDEVWAGGAEADCPSIADVHLVEDPTTGGPHDLALDHAGGGRRVVAFNYFVSETGVEGDLRACMLLIQDGRLALDPRFPAAVDGQAPGSGCVGFDRVDWPGDRGLGAGPAKPHHGLFRAVG